MFYFDSGFPPSLSKEESLEKLDASRLLPPFTHLGYVAEIFKPLNVSLGEILESRLSPCSWLLRLGLTPNEAKGGRPY